MTPSKLPANVSVAPNSPRQRAKDSAAPDNNAGAARGSVTRNSVRVGDDPRPAAISS